MTLTLQHHQNNTTHNQTQGSKFIFIDIIITKKALEKI